MPGAPGATPHFPGLTTLGAGGAVGATPAVPTPWRTTTWRPNAALEPIAQVDAEYSVHDPNFFRDDDWKFGHDAGTYHLDRTQDGKVVRRASGTEQSNPELVAGVRRLERQAATSIAGGGSGVQPGDYRGYYHSGSGRSSYYSMGDFVAVDDRTTNRRAWVLQRSSAATGLIDGVQQLDRAQGKTVDGTDGGEASGWEKAGKVGGIVAFAGALVGLAYLTRGSRLR